MESTTSTDIGYVRVSTKHQNLERQIRNILAAYPNAHIVKEKFTGTTMERKEWSKVMNVVKPGDRIIFDSVSRMSRNADEGFAVYQELYEKGVELVFLKEPHINTAVYKDAVQAPQTGDKDIDETLIKGLNEYFLRIAKRQIRIAFDQAEKEVEDLHQRIREGMLTAKLEGKPIGVQPGTKRETKKGQAVRDCIKKYSKDFGGTLKDMDVIKLAGCSNKTYYTYKKELLAMSEAEE